MKSFQPVYSIPHKPKSAPMYSKVLSVRGQEADADLSEVHILKNHTLKTEAAPSQGLLLFVAKLLISQTCNL
jgi:hypothetical protein